MGSPSSLLPLIRVSSEQKVTTTPPAFGSAVAREWVRSPVRVKPASTCFSIWNSAYSSALLPGTE
ncbi:hypothetical protein C0R01_00590 [Streptomyces albidoflavus]|nr:hypothetical protein C0R00_00950 [Streptomyces albidoflavus]RZE86026.1 hypothetical protein C0R01_00590 [Streptomyces albidoflavus]